MRSKGIKLFSHLPTFSLSHFLTFSLSHFLTFSLSHFPTFSLSHLPTFSLSHLPTFSPFRKSQRHYAEPRSAGLHQLFGARYYGCAGGYNVVYYQYVFAFHGVAVGQEEHVFHVLVSLPAVHLRLAGFKRFSFQCFACYRYACYRADTARYFKALIIAALALPLLGERNGNYCVDAVEKSVVANSFAAMRPISSPVSGWLRYFIE